VLGCEAEGHVRGAVPVVFPDPLDDLEEDPAAARGEQLQQLPVVGAVVEQAERAEVVHEGRVEAVPPAR
jgi:hypothetical protein